MIDVEVRTERGEVVARASCALDWMKSLQYVDESEFPMLGSLLPYADTIFNSRQTRRLRMEIANDRIRELIGGDAVAEIDRLCVQVQNGAHLYLWFVGD